MVSISLLGKNRGKKRSITGLFAGTKAYGYQNILGLLKKIET
jgi:hypothetical protein